MKIAQIAPLAEPAPSRFHGETERVVSYLTAELARLGHDVSRFASDEAEAIRELAHRFDVLHFHADTAHFPLFRHLAHKTVTTLHDRTDLPGVPERLREFRDLPLVSISASQRAAAPDANWTATVHPGLPAEVCPLNPALPRNGRYVAFLGRVSSDKSLELAVDVAMRARMRLKIAAKIHPGEDAHYWRAVIVPRLQAAPGLIDYVGEVDEAAKPAFLGNAAALLFPIQQPEPFGFAMIEAMSCGTPVIAWPNGAAPEIVEDGLTGYLVSSVDDAVRALDSLPRLDRTRVRERFDQRFSVEHMARDYLAVYRRLGRRRGAPLQAAHP